MIKSKVFAGGLHGSCRICLSLLLMSAAADVAFASSTSSSGIIDPINFGAHADGVTNDAPALNKAYDAARAEHVAIFLRGRTYRLDGPVLANGVSTMGEGASLLFSVNSASNSWAFSWGGTDTEVADVSFVLSNGGSSAMQGVLNSVNNASNQRFIRNHIVCNTLQPKQDKSNIYGVWVSGTGLTGLYIDDNQIEGCGYGVWVNNQQGVTRSVISSPLGRPSQHIHISGNVLVDAALGVNTPHIYVNDVVISENTIEPGKLVLDLPLSVAHASKVTISGNSVTSNAASGNGTLHVEDASGAVAIVGNTVTALGTNNGIQLTLSPGASHDVMSMARVIVSGNHVEGNMGSDNVAGILLADLGTKNATITGNYVTRFGRGIVTVSVSSVQGNTIAGCTTPLVSRGGMIAGNMVTQ